MKETVNPLLNRWLKQLEDFENEEYKTTWKRIQEKTTLDEQIEILIDQINTLKILAGFPRNIRLAANFLIEYDNERHPGVTFEEIESCEDIEQLLEMNRIIPPYNKTRKAINARLSKLIQERLDSMTDYDYLCSLHREIGLSHLMRHKMEVHMSDLIRSVSAHNPSSWFIAIITGQLPCCSGVVHAVRDKCKEIITLHSTPK